MLEYTVKSDIENIYMKENVILCTPSESEIGKHKVSVSASDGTIQTTSSFNITVVESSSDKEAPVLVSTTPKDSAIQIPLNPLILVTLADYGAGIDQSSVMITLDDRVIYSGSDAKADAQSGKVMYSTSNSKCICKGNEARYTFQYQETDLFDYDYSPTVTVTARDLKGNEMEPYTFSFTTEMYSMCASVPVDSTTKSGSSVKQSSPDALTAADGTVWTAWDDGSKVYLSNYKESKGKFTDTQYALTSGKQLDPAITESFRWQDLCGLAGLFRRQLGYLHCLNR